MNWLHSFWGVGASISLFLMAYELTNQLGWSSGYRFIGIIQTLLTAGLPLYPFGREGGLFKSRRRYRLGR